MDIWQDEGIILSVRPHSEKGGIASILTRDHGRHAGYVFGARSSRMRGSLEMGNFVSVEWQSRVSENLGNYKVELNKSHVAVLMDDPRKLVALQSACALADKTLAERDKHQSVYEGLRALLEAFETEVWSAAYIYWEMGLLKELGFGLDLTVCAATGNTDNLIYVSPKSGRAVSAEAGEIYKEKLLKLPGFLRGESDVSDQEILNGLDMTAYFLQHRVFSTMNIGLPDARLRLAQHYTA